MLLLYVLVTHRGRMRRLPVHLLFVSELLVCAATPAELSEDTLKQLSAAGRQYVVEEIQLALQGMKHMKEMVQKTEENHKHLMEALTHSYEKKMVEELFSKSASLEHVQDHGGESLVCADSPGNQANAAELELLQADASFNLLLTRISLLHDRSALLLADVQQSSWKSFLTEFHTELRPGPTRKVESPPGSWANDLDQHPVSVFNFGQNVAATEEVREPKDYLQHTSRESSTFGPSQNKYLCRRLRKRASECWRLQSLCEACEENLLKVCPSVRPLQSEMEEMIMLLKASRQQHADRLLLVQRHTEETQRWLSNMADQSEWISRLFRDGRRPGDIFSMTAMTSRQQMNDGLGPGRGVIVTLLDSAPIRISVPAELLLEDPAFIQRVVQESLTGFKQQITSTELGSGAANPTS
ncbi:clusterin-like [Takifugu flavidus]|uniref:clusterin-like n=1 Tax=Takifugu flavidus TaxID=433684 RepID=UPI002544CF73|nr:clusterin-like [Takifugu flavidus]